MSCQSVLSTKGITIRTTAVNVDPLIGNQVIPEEYRGLDSLPLRQLFHLPGKEIARALVSSQLYSDQNIDPFKLSRIDARLYLAFLMKYDNKATLMRKRDAVREFYRFLKNEYQVNRNEFEFFDRMKVTQDLPKFPSQEKAARLPDTIEPNTELMEFNPAAAATDPAKLNSWRSGIRLCLKQSTVVVYGRKKPRI